VTVAYFRTYLIVLFFEHVGYEVMKKEFCFMFALPVSELSLPALRHWAQPTEWVPSVENIYRISQQLTFAVAKADK